MENISNALSIKSEDNWSSSSTLSVAVQTVVISLIPAASTVRLPVDDKICRIPIDSLEQRNNVVM